MTTQKFPKGSEGLLDRTIDLTGDVRCMLVKSAYTYDAADEFLADLGAVDNGRTAALAGKTYSGGVFDATDTSLVATSAVACNALVLFQHTGNDATARVVGYIDDATGLPFTPGAGQSIPITWDNGANKIMAI